MPGGLIGDVHLAAVASACSQCGAILAAARGLKFAQDLVVRAQPLATGDVELILITPYGIANTTISRAAAIACREGYISERIIALSGSLPWSIDGMRTQGGIAVTEWPRRAIELKGLK